MAVSGCLLMRISDVDQRKDLGAPLPSEFDCVPAKQPVWRDWGYYIRFNRPEARVKGKSRWKRRGSHSVGVAVLVTPSVDRKLAMSLRWEIALGSSLRPRSYMQESMIIPLALGVVASSAASYWTGWNTSAVVVGVVLVFAALLLYSVYVAWAKKSVFGAGEGLPHDALLVSMDSPAARLVRDLDRVTVLWERGQVSDEDYSRRRSETFRALADSWLEEEPVELARQVDA